MMETDADTAPALEIVDLSFAYGATKALDRVSLTAPRGAFTALLGVNGAGKTTLFNLVTRLFAAREGRISVCGCDIRGAPRDAMARMGVVFQSRALDANLTVAQNAAYHGALHGLPRADALARAEAALAQVGLLDKMGEKVGRLSGGQQRRAEIAQALLHEPELLLCDEPTTGLDLESRAAIVRDAHALAAERGVGVLWATHLIDEVAPADRVVVLHKGRVRAAGTASDLAGDGALSDMFLKLTRAPEAAVEEAGA
ncbi:MAG: ATP-binding cassette domain-containing protein [Rubrimonas sp.]|uniref:ATP-binding cassette domain-containing protein n=1 Tax=Rubrimonas sp. TaxID=2036015 RepID=UPI002FDD1231